MTCKSFIKSLIPPILLSLLQSLRKNRENQWIGNYSDWESAVRASSGYDIDDIFQHALSAARKVRDGEALWERDSVCFYHEEYNWPLLACLLIEASHNDNKLHVLDFGGAFGSVYMQHRSFFSSLKECSWNIAPCVRIDVVPE